MTMLQRSPTYIVSLPGEDPIANFLRRVLPSKAAYAITRWKNVLVTTAFFQLSRRAPAVRQGPAAARPRPKALPPGYDVKKHFKPSYNPWDQRVCLVPDGDLFEAIKAGSASIETDTIDTFTETGDQARRRARSSRPTSSSPRPA